MISVLFLFLIKFSGDDFDELLFGDDQFSFDIFSFFKGFIICSIDELHDLLFSEIFLEILDYFGEAFLGYDFGIRVFVDKKTEGFLDVLLAVLLTHFDDHDFEELLEVDFGFIVFGILLAVAQVSNKVADFLVAGIEA